ncbi:hypothetical protein HII36_18460 [Nonomuraea sp. NN258]|uniref:hypothetical protein n=1 Tax=Nonomuraea antri TaxID=2730852 RepID=UPI0015697ABA|nr:hypothetical protein [Nonomuraea antri]NRQ33819.1 hypothetical protein [Nonomuraea antri]
MTEAGGPPSLWRLCFVLVLAVAMPLVLSVRESWPPEPPYAGGVHRASVDGRALVLEVSGRGSSSACLTADRVEAAETGTSVRVRVMLRDVCRKRERTLLEKWREELWPPVTIRVGAGVEVTVMLDRPLGRRKVVDERGHEVRVCPIVGSRWRTLGQCMR